ncbi:MAG: arginine deiminase family protein [Eubacteriales bacterium]
MIDGGVCISSMANNVRARETLFGQYLFTHHPLYKNTPMLHARTDPFSIEGGDVLVLSNRGGRDRHVPAHRSPRGGSARKAIDL